MTIEQSTVISGTERVVVKTRQLSVDEKVQQEAWHREKQLHDEASALRWSEVITIAKLVKRGLLTEAQGAEESGMTLFDFQQLMETYSQNI